MIKVRGQARRIVFTYVAIAIGLTIAAALASSIMGTALIGAAVGGGVWLLSGPRLVEIDDGIVKVFADQVVRRPLLAEGAVESVRLHDSGGHRLEIGDLTVWLARGQFRQLTAALAGA